MLRVRSEITCGCPCPFLEQGGAAAADHLNSLSIRQRAAYSSDPRRRPLVQTGLDFSGAVVDERFRAHLARTCSEIDSKERLTVRHATFVHLGLWLYPRWPPAARYAATIYWAQAGLSSHGYRLKAIPRNLPVYSLEELTAYFDEVVDCAECPHRAALL